MVAEVGDSSHYSETMPGMTMDHDVNVCPQTLMDGLCTLVHAVSYSVVGVFATAPHALFDISFVELFLCGAFAYSLVLIRRYLYALRRATSRVRVLHVELFRHGVLHGKAF